MLTVADVKCYHCGFVSGEVSLEDGKPLRASSFKPATTCAKSDHLRAGRLRCCRCGGPVYLDDVRTVRPQPVVSIEEARPRRGRPRRSETLARAS